MTPDPTLPDVVEAFKKGEIKEFERRSRLGFVDHAGFLKEVARLRKVGFKRITLKTGAYGLPELAIAGGFSDETHVFKALALGAPNFKAVCIGRALMIPGMVGKNIGEWIKKGDLPKTVSKFGTRSELMRLSEECEKVTGIPYVMRAYRKEAEKILAQ